MKKFFVNLLSVSVIVLLCLSSSAITFSLSDEQKALYNKNILYYDLACPDGAPDGASGPIKSVYMVGDSITLGAKDSYNLEKKFTDKGINAYITASGGGSLITAGSTGSRKTGLDSIRDDADQHVKNVDAVIIAHGTNHVPAGFEDALKETIKTVRNINSSAAIFWVKTHTDAPGNAAANPDANRKKNDIIDKQADQLNFTAIDTSSVPIASDGIHPEFAESGHGKWGDTVVNAVAESGGGAGFDKLNTSVDLASIAEEFDLHSAAVRQLGSSASTSHRANQSPESVASIIKLIIADAFLSTDPNLNKSITIKGSQLYGGGTPQGTPWDPRAGQKFTLKQVLTNALEKSSNVQANVLIDETGGLGKVNQIAGQLGYNSTNITSYFKFSGSGTPRSSTAGDLTNAMNKIFKTKTNKYRVAQDALRNSTYKFGLDSEANKWGGHSSFTGNTGLFSAKGEKYIITVLLEEKWQDEVLPDYPGTRGTTPSASVGKIKKATDKIISSITGESQESVDGCDCPATALEGDNNAIKAYNFLINEMDLTPAQVAGIIGNLMRESADNNYNIDPTARGENQCSPDCMGIAQWNESTRFAALEAWAGSKNKDPLALETQVEYIKIELESAPQSKYDGGNGLNLLKAVSGDNEAAAREAADIFDDHFERSDRSTVEDRKENAARFFREHIKGGGITGGSPDGNNNCSGGDGISTGQFAWPDGDKKGSISSCFGWRPSTGSTHEGVDIGIPVVLGDDVTASDGGKVTEIGGSFGIVTIDHGNGYTTRYLHNSVIEVAVGDKVDQGDVIAKVGGAGDRGPNSYDPHIHIEIIRLSTCLKRDEPCRGVTARLAQHTN
jgi:murein DD-endopeptidase MepM/ murein hydrolase activator NlpD